MTDFEYTTELAGVTIRVAREGKHANLHVQDDGLWNFEEIDQAIPKLEQLLIAAKLAQEA